MIDIIENIIGNLVLFIPFILIAFLVNLSERNRTPEYPHEGEELGFISYMLIILGFTSTFLIGIGLHLMGTGKLKGLGVDQLSQFFKGSPFGTSHILDSLQQVGMGMWIPSLVAFFLFIPLVRRGLAKFLPIDPLHRMHTVAMVWSMLVVMGMWTTLGFGADALVQQDGPVETLGSALSDLWSQDILSFIFALFGIGWLSRRGWVASLQRLGIRRPTLLQIAMGLGIGIVFAWTSIGIDLLSSHLGISTDPDTEKFINDMMDPLFGSAAGILSLGLAPALGEEAIFRGALLPRFGILLTSILFALMHTQYGLSTATLVVFLFALALGWIRKHSNTSTTMIIHATYNIGLGVITYFNIV